MRFHALWKCSTKLNASAIEEAIKVLSDSASGMGRDRKTGTRTIDPSRNPGKPGHVGWVSVTRIRRSMVDTTQVLDALDKERELLREFHDISMEQLRLLDDESLDGNAGIVGYPIQPDAGTNSH